MRIYFAHMSTVAVHQVLSHLQARVLDEEALSTHLGKLVTMGSSFSAFKAKAKTDWADLADQLDKHGQAVSRGAGVLVLC